MAHIIADFQKDYSGTAANKVRDIVEQVYKETMSARVAHSEEMMSLVGRKVVDDMRSPMSLTMSLLGMFAEDAVIRQRLVQAIGRRRVPHKDAA